MDKDIPSRSWLRALPKAELHLHLEGTVSPQTLVLLSQRHDPTPLTLSEFRSLYTYTDFLHFLRTFKLVLDRLQTPEDYALITREMLRNLHAQGVVPAEVYIAWGNILHWKAHLKVEDVMVAVEEARVEVERELGGPSLLWIADTTRQFGVKHVGKVFRLAAELKKRFPSVVGVGIGGNEAAGPTEWFGDVYTDARKARLRLTAHAGEAMGEVQGPVEMRAALALGAERIGHGLAAQYDEELMGMLAESQVALEVNVTSNVLTSSCAAVEEHPLPRFLEKGILCALGSDDPTMFGSDCLDEYVLVSETFGFDKEMMKQLARNSIHASFLPDQRKKDLLAEIDLYT